MRHARPRAAARARPPRPLGAPRLPAPCRPPRRRPRLRPTRPRGLPRRRRPPRLPRLLRGSEAKATVTTGRVEGVGLGLRLEFTDKQLARSVGGEALPIDFLEISPENYMARGGRQAASLASLAQRYPVLTHGLTMSVGGVDPLDARYLRELAAFVRDVGSPWHSDHLC